MKYCYINSRLEPESEARISIHDRGFLYGDGFFETILSVNGRLQFLKEHLERLENSCRLFRINLTSDIDWSRKIGIVLDANGLTKETAAVKIIITRGEYSGGLVLDDDIAPTVIMTAKPYQRISEEKIKNGFKLSVFPEPRSSFLAHHKSLNYLYYISARDYAVHRGADEAIITDPEGRILECATANIFLRNGKTILKPPSGAPYLKGIEEKFVISSLKEKGFAIDEDYFNTDTLKESDEVFISNSLIGVVPVSDIDGFLLRSDFEAATYLQKELFKMQELDNQKDCLYD